MGEKQRRQQQTYIGYYDKTSVHNLESRLTQGNTFNLLTINMKSTLSLMLLVVFSLMGIACGFSTQFRRSSRLSTSSMQMNSDKTFSKLIPLLLSGAVFLQAPNIRAEDYVPPKYENVAAWDGGIKYSVVKNGKGPNIKVGDLVEIRFLGSYQGKSFDDTFSTPEPYYYRAGVGSIVKGIDECVLHMQVGDRWKVIFSGTDLSFPNGVKAAPGKPRIPAGAEVEYELELVNLPGTGDDFIADFE